MPEIGPVDSTSRTAPLSLPNLHPRQVSLKCEEPMRCHVGADRFNILALRNRTTAEANTRFLDNTRSLDQTCIATNESRWRLLCLHSRAEQPQILSCLKT